MIGWLKLYNLERDWLIELSENKLSSKNLASDLVKNRSFLNQSLTRKLQVTQKELLLDSSPARFFKLLNFSNYGRPWILFCCPLTMDWTIHCFGAFMDKNRDKDSAVWKGNSRVIDFQFHPFVFLRWNGTLYLDQKVSLNLVKKKINCVLLHSWTENEFWRFCSQLLLWQSATAFWSSVL